MTDCVSLHLLPRVAAAVSVDSLRRDISLPSGYVITAVEEGVSRKSSTAIPLVLLTVSVDGPASAGADELAPQTPNPDVEAAVIAAATSAYRRTLPTSADIPIYIKHSRGFAISRGGLDALRISGLPDTFMDDIGAGATAAPFRLDDHLWFNDGVRAGLVAKDEPTKMDWRDIQRSLEAAESAMARLTRKRVERSY